MFSPDTSLAEPLEVAEKPHILKLFHGFL